MRTWVSHRIRTFFEKKSKTIDEVDRGRRRRKGKVHDGDGTRQMKFVQEKHATEGIKTGRRTTTKKT